MFVFSLHQCHSETSGRCCQTVSMPLHNHDSYTTHHVAAPCRLCRASKTSMAVVVKTPKADAKLGGKNRGGFWSMVLYIKQMAGRSFRTCAHYQSGQMEWSPKGTRGWRVWTRTHAPCLGLKWGRGIVDVSNPQSPAHSNSAAVYLFPCY